jgi:repressor LexA
MSITQRQSDVLNFIESFTRDRGYSPTYEEIAKGIGLRSIATVHKHITNLERRGRITRAANNSRSIDVVPEGKLARFRLEGERLYDTYLKCYWVKEITP